MNFTIKRPKSNENDIPARIYHDYFTFKGYCALKQGIMRQLAISQKINSYSQRLIHNFLMSLDALPVIQSLI